MSAAAVEPVRDPRWERVRAWTEPGWAPGQVTVRVVVMVGGTRYAAAGIVDTLRHPDEAAWAFRRNLDRMVTQLDRHLPGSVA